MAKKELTERCREILRSVPVGDTLNPGDADWLVQNVFVHHPEWGWYSVRGIMDVSVGKADHGTTCFYIHFAFGDRQKASISFIKCIKNI